jgi:DNA (cytosine-5)-methyltransferase 1
MTGGLPLRITEPGTVSVHAKTFCEFFAGIGLVRDALSRSGWQCVYANDIDPKKRELYDLRFGQDGHFHLGDVWHTADVVARIGDRPFLATASFPCTDMSLAGHWRGFTGEHSSTFFGFSQAMDALAARRPRVVMIENVTGFLTSKDGKDFEAAVRTLAELGYWIDAFIVDAKFFLPQSRPRVFIVGIDDSIETPFASRESAFDWLGCRWRRTLQKADDSLRPSRLIKLMQSIELPTGWVAFDLPTPSAERRDISRFIDLDDNQDWWDQSAVTKHHDMMSDRHRGQVDHMLSEGKTFVGTIFRRKRDGKTRAEVRFDGMAGCLRTPKGGSARQIVIVIDKGVLRMRWMSAREYARLQGAEDFPLVENNIQNLFGFGDAVCVPVVQWIDDNVLTPMFDFVRTMKGGCLGRQSDAGATTPNDAGGQRSEYVA